MVKACPGTLVIGKRDPARRVMSLAIQLAACRNFGEVNHRFATMASWDNQFWIQPFNTLSNNAIKEVTGSQHKGEIVSLFGQAAAHQS